jgi:capsular exopolysaccharide synthesis family protein
MSTLQPESASSSELASIEDYIEALRRRKLLPLVGLLIALGLALTYTGGRVNIYTATSRVLVGATPVGSTNQALRAPNLDREAEIIVSDPIARQAGSLVGGDVDALQLRRDLEVQFQPGSDVIRLSFSDESREFAAAVANAFATSYVEDRVGQQAGYYEDLIAALDAQIALLDTELATLDALVAELDAERASLLALGTPQETAPRRDDIASERQTATAQRNGVLSTLRQLNAEKQDLETDVATLAPPASFLREAAIPSSPIGVASRTILVGAALFGLLAGSILALLLYRLDKTATDARDVEMALGTRVIGRIPKIGWRSLSGDNAVVVASGNKSVSHQRGREAFRRLRASVEFLNSSSAAKTLLITSTQPGEGKSVTAANLASALAGRGSKVALVSADLRRPTIDTFFGTQSASGLSDFVGGVVTDLNFVPVEGTPGLQIVPSGPIPENPGELLGSSLFEHIAQELRSHVDYVIFDTPPIGSAADAVGLASLVDGVILVVDGTKTTTDELVRVRAEIEQSGGRLLGAVMNRDRTERQSFLKRSSRYSYEKSVRA